jgi:hypothetical protein
MPNAVVTFPADVLGDQHYVLTLVQTGLDTADFDKRGWPIGSDYNQPPASDQSYQLTNIRVLGNKMTCKTQVMWFVTDDIELDLSPPLNTPSATIKVTGLGGSTMVERITQADHDLIAKFYVEANYPAG